MKKMNQKRYVYTEAIYILSFFCNSHFISYSPSVQLSPHFSFSFATDPSGFNFIAQQYTHSPSSVGLLIDGLKAHVSTMFSAKSRSYQHLIGFRLSTFYSLLGVFSQYFSFTPENSVRVNPESQLRELLNLLIFQIEFFPLFIRNFSKWLFITSTRPHLFRSCEEFENNQTCLQAALAN